jgi:hypothetical protein
LRRAVILGAVLLSAIGSASAQGQRPPQLANPASVRCVDQGGGAQDRKASRWRSVRCLHLRRQLPMRGMGAVPRRMPKGRIARDGLCNACWPVLRHHRRPLCRFLRRRPRPLKRVCVRSPAARPAMPTPIMPGRVHDERARADCRDPAPGKCVGHWPGKGGRAAGDRPAGQRQRADRRAAWAREDACDQEPVKGAGVGVQPYPVHA